MKLLDVWNAAFSSPQHKPVSAWGALTALKKPPKVAYRLLKYGAKLGAELEVIDGHRTKLLYEAAGVPEGSPVEIKAGSLAFEQFTNDFNAFLAGDSDLEPVGMSMDELIDSLGDGAISENDLAAVEPFFQVKTAEKPAE